jgi:guanylate kinase
MPIITVSGRSGSGKDALVHQLLAKLPQTQRLQSVTTRAPREGEHNSGYLHVSEEEFRTLSESQSFLWEVGEFGNRYGTKKTAAKKALSHGLYFSNLVPQRVTDLHCFAIESGKKHCMRSIYLFMQSEDELRRRMLGRGDSPEQVEERIRKDRHWDDVARHDANRYLFMDALGTLEDKALQALWWLQKNLPASLLSLRVPHQLPLP